MCPIEVHVNLGPKQNTEIFTIISPESCMGVDGMLGVNRHAKMCDPGLRKSFNKFTNKVLMTKTKYLLCLL